jgi:hypothetical protein
MKKLLSILIIFIICFSATEVKAKLTEVRPLIFKFERILRLEYRLNDITIAAIIGNSLHETGQTLNYKEKQKDADGKDLKGSSVPFGLFQFTGTQLIDYKKFLGEKKDSFEKQIDFFMKVVITKDTKVPHNIGWTNRKKLRIIFKYPESVEEVTRALVKYYFRPGKPHIDKRIKLANYVYGLMQDMYIEEIISYDRCN